MLVAGICISSVVITCVPSQYVDSFAQEIGQHQSVLDRDISVYLEPFGIGTRFVAGEKEVRFGHSQKDMVALEAARVIYFFFQAEDGIRDLTVTGVQTCALPI